VISDAIAHRQLKALTRTKGPYLLQHISNPSRPAPVCRSCRPSCAVRELASRVQSASPIGQYSAPLAAVKLLVSIEPIAKALVGLKTFKPDLKAGTGRALQLPGSSWLGPCFSVSCYPDELVNSQPDVAKACFLGATTDRGANVRPSRVLWRVEEGGRAAGII
jgi:hypothetical protein